MASLNLDILEAVVEALCPHCTPRHLLADLACLSANCVNSCRGDDEEQARIRALAALCLASKQIGAVATRHLYHRPTTTRWPFLARTLITRPDLARRVRHLCARGYAHAEAEAYKPDFPPEVGLCWANRVRFPNEAWFERLRRTEATGDTGAPELFEAGNIALDLVVSLCPTLEELDAALTWGPRFSLSPPASLPSLRTVVAAHHDTEDGFNLAMLENLAPAAPGLRTLVGRHVGRWLESEMRFEGLTRLRIEEGGLGLDCLCNALRACPRLEAFEYRAGEVAYPQFTPRGASTALVELAPGLRRLVLDLDEVDSLTPSMGRGWVLRPLRELRKLRSLEIDTRCLVPHKNPMSTTHRRRPDGTMAPIELVIPEVDEGALVKVLPESICEVKITRGGYGPGIEKLGAALGTLAAAADGFPKLGAVLVQGGWDGDEGVMRAFEEKGITFASF